MLSFVALISGLYDFVVGAFLLLAADRFAALFGVEPATPRIFSDLNGLFLLAVGLGYALSWRDPRRYRGYLWIMGPFLKGAGATAFILNYAYRGSPAAFLLFAASDGALALLTLGALLRSANPHRLTWGKPVYPPAAGWPVDKKARRGLGTPGNERGHYARRRLKR